MQKINVGNYCLHIAYLFILLFLSLESNAAPQTPDQACLLLDGDAKQLNVLPSMSHYWDINGNIAVPTLDSLKVDKTAILKSLSKKLNNNEFAQVIQPSKELVLGKGGTNHWLHFCLANTSLDTQHFVLRIAPAITADVDFYPFKSGVQSFQTGNAHPISSRDIYSTTFDFSVRLEGGETQAFYLRIKSRSNAYIRASIWSEENYSVFKDKLEILDGIFIGIFLGLILYTILLYFSVRQSSSLLYIFWCLSILTLLASIDGRVLQYFVPEMPSISHFVVVLFYPLSIFLSALFVRNFIQLKNYPRLDRLGIGIVLLFGLGLLVAYQFGYATYFRLCALFAVLVILHYGLITPIYGMVSQQSQFCRYLLTAQLPLIICMLDRTVFGIGFSSQYYVPFTPKVGLVIEMVLMAYFLGLKIHNEKNEALSLVLQQELEAKQLAEMDQMKSDFFTNVSHELRTPLTLIQGPLVELSKQQQGNDKEVIEGVIRQSKNINKLVDQFLMLSKFDSGLLNLKPVKLSINEIIGSLTSQFSSLAASKGLTLEFKPYSQDVWAFADVEKLEIIVNNLLSNAIKFSPKGEQVIVEVCSNADLQIEDSERSTDEYVVITVSDTGTGIADNELEHVFDRFFQSGTSEYSKSGVGTGIGLSLVKELVESHGGQVSVAHNKSASNLHSSNSRGTVFTVSLPLGNAHLRHEEMVASARSLRNANSEHSDQRPEAENRPKDRINKDTTNKDASNIVDINQTKPTILIVDDNDDMRLYIKGLLQTQYTVIEARDGLHAEAVAKQALPDLIITDLMMPKRDGVGFVESLKRKTNSKLANTPVIMLTAKAGINDRLTGLMAAIDDYLTKPFDADELKARIHNLLKKQAQFQAFYGASSFASKRESASNGQTKEQRFVIKARSILSKHLHKPDFGVNELAEHLHVSRATLARRLSEATQFTPSEFIRHCRLEKARQLSNQGQVASLKELAAAVGFSQAGYFSRLYQKTFNTVPLAKQP